MASTVEIRGLTVRYRDRVAVDDVSLSIPAGATLGLVGESGSGKSSIAKAVVGMVRPTAGEVLVDGRAVSRFSSADRRRVQMVFQDPNSSLNPMMTVRQCLGEALRAAGVPRAERTGRSIELLETVRLDPVAALDRVPSEFSGGQRQRIAIARSIAVQPSVLVADEPTSALDVSVQSAVLDLLATVRQRLGLTVLFISHDLGVINAVADTVAVMRDGRIVETAARETFFSHPTTEYAKALLRAVPRLPDPTEGVADASVATGPSTR
jgi:peptide/nickel transport system ATP-binding protein